MEANKLVYIAAHTHAHMAIQYLECHCSNIVKTGVTILLKFLYILLYNE